MNIESILSIMWVACFVASALYMMASGIQLNQYLKKSGYSHRLGKYGLPTKEYFSFLFGKEYFHDNYLKLLKNDFRRAALIMGGIFFIPLICFLLYIILRNILFVW